MPPGQREHRLDRLHCVDHAALVRDRAPSGAKAARPAAEGPPMGVLGLIEPLDPLALDSKKVRAF
jgi:hypothetical protein